MARSEALPTGGWAARQAVAPPPDDPARPSRPFADDMSGADYFRTDQHYRAIAGAISWHLKEMRGFVLVSGEPPADGRAIEVLLCEDKRKAILLPCQPGIS